MQAPARHRARVALLLLVAVPTAGCAEFWSAGPGWQSHDYYGDRGRLCADDAWGAAILVGIVGVVALARAIGEACEALFRPQVSSGGIPWDSPEGVALRQESPTPHVPQGAHP